MPATTISVISGFVLALGEPLQYAALKPVLRQVLYALFRLISAATLPPLRFPAAIIQLAAGIEGKFHGRFSQVRRKNSVFLTSFLSNPLLSFRFLICR